MLRTTILKKLNIQFNRPESFIFDAVERGLRYGFMRFLKKNSAFEEALERAANSDDKLNAIFSVLYEYEDYLVEQQRSATENELYDLLSFKEEEDE